MKGNLGFRSNLIRENGDRKIIAQQRKNRRKGGRKEGKARSDSVNQQLTNKVSNQIFTLRIPGCQNKLKVSSSIL